MMKFSTILTEGKDKKVKLTPQDKKILSILEKKEINRDPYKVLDFLIHTLIIEDTNLLTRLLKLYINNYGVTGETFNEMDTAVLDRGYETYDEQLLALADYMELDPFYITKEWEGSKDGDEVYLPSYQIYYPVKSRRENSSKPTRIDSWEFLAAGSAKEAYDAAITQVREDLDSNGYDWFSSDFVEQFIIDGDWWIDEEARRMAENELMDVDEEEMRYQIGVRENYNDAVEEIEYIKKEIVTKLGEIQELEFQRDNIEKEKIILEKEIETLGGNIEYEDDNPNYNEFSDEIERLQIKLNETERFYIEIQTMIEMSYAEKYKMDKDLKDSQEEAAKYSGSELEDDYINDRQEVWVENIENDRLAYLEDYLGIDSLFDAIREGYIEIDDEEMIETAVRVDGIEHFLASYDGEEREVDWGDNTYYFYRTN